MWSARAPNALTRVGAAEWQFSTYLIFSPAFSAVIFSHRKLPALRINPYGRVGVKNARLIHFCHL